MSKRSNVEFEVVSWEEKPIIERESGPRLTCAEVRQRYSGDIEGEASLHYLMMSREDGSSSYIGLELLTGSVGRRSGSFVLRHSGSFEKGIVTDECSVIEDSGTGELRGLRGRGGFSSSHQKRYRMTFDLEFE